jgi:hypothetical protein
LLDPLSSFATPSAPPSPLSLGRRRRDERADADDVRAGGAGEAPYLPGDGDKVAAAELCFRSELGREDEGGLAACGGADVGPAPPVMKAVLENAKYEGKESPPLPAGTRCSNLSFICFLRGPFKVTAAGGLTLLHMVPRTRPAYGCAAAVLLAHLYSIGHRCQRKTLCTRVRPSAGGESPQPTALGDGSPSNPWICAYRLEHWNCAKPCPCAYAA